MRVRTILDFARSRAASRRSPSNGFVRVSVAFVINGDRGLESYVVTIVAGEGLIPRSSQLYASVCASRITRSDAWRWIEETKRSSSTCSSVTSGSLWRKELMILQLSVSGSASNTRIGAQSSWLHGSGFDSRVSLHISPFGSQQFCCRQHSVGRVTFWGSISAPRILDLAGLTSSLRSSFITHLHSDHTLGYPDPIFYPWGTRTATAS
jgi:hypothetical protein